MIMLYLVSMAWLNVIGTTLSDVEVDPTYALDECQGDCDDDSSCSGDLICFYNEVGETNTPPGCSGTATDNWDYCYDGTLIYDVEVDPTYALDECQGDCDDDGDCSGDLICFHNDNGATDTPSGCSGTATANWDYCYDSGFAFSWASFDRPIVFEVTPWMAMVVFLVLLALCGAALVTFVRCCSRTKKNQYKVVSLDDIATDSECDIPMIKE